MDIRALNAFMSQVQPPQMQGPSQYSGQSSVLANLGAGMAPRFDNMAGNRDASEIEQLIRGMAALKAQAAQAQVPQAMGQPERFGGREAQTVGIVAALAAALGANPQVTGQAANNFANVRQGQFNQDWQTRAQDQQTQAAQRLADIQGRMYEAEGQYNVVDRRENNRAARRSERLKVEGQRAAQQFTADEAEKERQLKREISANTNNAKDPAAILERFRQQGIAMGMTPEDALIFARSAADKETAAEAARTGAQGALYSAKTKTEDATRDAVVERIVQQGKYSKQQALLVAEKIKYLPEEMAFKAAMVELAINKFGENQYQFDTKQAQDAVGDIQSQMEDYNGEVKKFEGDIKKLKEDFVTKFGFDAGVLENNAEGHTQLAWKLQEMAAEAERILAGKPNKEGIAPDEQDMKLAREFVVAARNLKGLTDQLRAAYQARDEMKAKLGSQGSAPGKAPAPAGAARNGGDLGRKYMAAGLKYNMARRGEKGYTDCSEFTQCVYKDMGIDIPPTAAPQYEASVPVEDEPREGDLLFFRAKSGPRSKMSASHVGIFIGYNKDGEPMMRHASSGAGKIVDVPVSSMNMKFLGARRPK